LQGPIPRPPLEEFSVVLGARYKGGKALLPSLAPHFTPSGEFEERITLGLGDPA